MVYFGERRILILLLNGCLNNLFLACKIHISRGFQTIIIIDKARRKCQFFMTSSPGFLILFTFFRGVIRVSSDFTWVYSVSSYSVVLYYRTYIEIINGRRNHYDSTRNRNPDLLCSTVSDTDRTSQQIKQMNIDKESKKEGGKAYVYRISCPLRISNRAGVWIHGICIFLRKPIQEECEVENRITDELITSDPVLFCMSYLVLPDTVTS